MSNLERRIFQALDDANYWASEAMRLEEKARLYRMREQQCRDSANGEPLKILEKENAA